MCVTLTPTLSFSCSICMQQGDGGGNNTGHESPTNLYGGTGGQPWNVDLRHGVRRITVAYDRWIDSICVESYGDGEPVRHGGDGGREYQMTLDRDEFLVSVSGSYFRPSELGGNLEVIRSLEFRTNTGNLEQFGPREIGGTAFTFPEQNGYQIVGMEGRSGDYLDAIGFRIARAPKCKLFLRIKEILRNLWPSNTPPISIVQCIGISM